MTPPPARPLAGRRVVVTRPAEQAEALCAAIAARGGEALRFPLLAIGPAADPAIFTQVAARLDDFDLAFFVSPNAVDHALDALLRLRLWPPHLRVATVGKGSERALAGRGFARVIAPTSGFDSEAVLALPEFAAEAVAGRRVVIFRGDGGRDLLGDTLRERGARVEYVTCYRRYCPDLDPAPLIAAARRGELDAVSLTSSEGVRNFAAILGEQGLAALRQVPVFASHPRIAEAAREAGFCRIVDTAPGDEGLLQALEAHFDY